MLDKRLLSFALIAGAGILAVAVAAAGYLRSDPDSAAGPTKVAESAVEPAADQPGTSERAADRSASAEATGKPVLDAVEVESEASPPETAGAERFPATAAPASDVATEPGLAMDETEVAPAAPAGAPSPPADRFVGEGTAGRTSSPASLTEATALSGSVEHQTNDVVPAPTTESATSAMSTVSEASSAAEPALVETPPPVGASDVNETAIGTDNQEEVVVPTVTVRAPVADSGNLQAAPDTQPADPLAAMKGDEPVAGSEFPAPDTAFPAAGGEPLAIDEGNGDHASRSALVAGDALPDPRSDASALPARNRPPLAALGVADLAEAGPDVSLSVDEQLPATPVDVLETIASAKDATPPPPSPPQPERSTLDTAVLAAKGEPSSIDDGNGDHAPRSALVAGDAPADGRSDPSALPARNRPPLAAPGNTDLAVAGPDLSLSAGKQPAATPAAVPETIASATDATRRPPSPKASERSTTATVEASTRPIEPDPVVDVAEREAREVAQMHFDMNSSYLSPGARMMVGRAIEALSGIEGAFRVEVVGYTDRVGSVSYNLWLAERRVHRVIEALAKAGIPRASLSGVPLGPFELPVPTDVGISEPLNRCVSVSVVAVD